MRNDMLLMGVPLTQAVTGTPPIVPSSERTVRGLMSATVRTYPEVVMRTCGTAPCRAVLFGITGTPLACGGLTDGDRD